ncbi:MAG: hypothetical protein LUH15_20075 [Tannerellaceae bacterium]|nr:hypothetical protein [Tannerellaceae bacterium]
MIQNIINKVFPLLTLLLILSCHKKVNENQYPEQEEDIPTDWFDVEEFWSHATGYSYTIFFENSDTIRIDMLWYPDIYIKQIQMKEGEITIQKDTFFYPCGKIKFLRQEWTGLFRSLFGKIYSFDQTGRVTKIKDMEESFPFTKEQVLSLLKEMNVELKYAYRFPNNPPDESPIWYTTCKAPLYPDNYTRHINIDGQTGIILKDTIID